jgi:hypothetical protein
MNAWKILGFTAALIVVAGVVMNWSDVKRYIKIENM